MNAAVHYRFAGMGQSGSPTAGQAVAGASGGGAAAAVQIIHGHYLSGVGTALLTAAPLSGPAMPFLAVAGAVAEILGAIGIGSGCGQTCIAATQFANQAEPLLQQNLSTYLALPVPRSPVAQTAALNVFDAVWAGLISVQACGNPALGDAGKRCISDRQRGACHYQNNGQCWNWFVGYRDPIANDPNVAAGSPVTSVLSSLGLNIDPNLLLVLAAAGVLAVVVLS